MGSIKWKGLVFLVLLSGCLSALSMQVAHAYILPAEQIIQFMAVNFSKTQTLIVHQYSEELNEENQKSGKGFDEILTMKSPDLFHSTIKESYETKGRGKDYSFRQFFLANSASRLMALLVEMGVDVQKVSYTRIDGVVAFRIGETDQASPKVLIEKGRFLPLLLSYKAPNLGGALAKAKFVDYRKVEQAWYPFEIFCSTADGTTEKYTVRSLKVNGPVSSSLFGSK
jgi:hypothetical protein